MIIDAYGNVNVSGKVTASSFSNDISCDWIGWKSSYPGIDCGATWGLRFVQVIEMYCS